MSYDYDDSWREYPAFQPDPVEVVPEHLTTKEVVELFERAMDRCNHPHQQHKKPKKKEEGRWARSHF